MFVTQKKHIQGIKFAKIEMILFMNEYRSKTYTSLLYFEIHNDYRKQLQY